MSLDGKVQYTKWLSPAHNLAWMKCAESMCHVFLRQPEASGSYRRQLRFLPVGPTGRRGEHIHGDLEEKYEALEVAEQGDVPVPLRGV